MIEHLVAEVSYECLRQRLEKWGTEGWIPWHMDMRHIIGDHRTIVTVWLYREATPSAVTSLTTAA
jgi:hypothetical protein